MIFMCVRKSVKPPFLDRDNGIRQQPPSQFKKQTHCLFCIMLSEKRNLSDSVLGKDILLELHLLSHVKSLKEVDCHPRRGRIASHIITLSPSTRQQSDITRFYTVRKHLPIIYLNSALVWIRHFPGVWRL